MLKYELDSKTRETAIEAMNRRKETGEYAEAELAPGVALVWDTDSDPYIVIGTDSPFHVGEPDCRHLADYGPMGDDLETAVVSILRSVAPNCYPETESDMDNSTDNMLIFHIHGLRPYIE